MNIEPFFPCWCRLHYFCGPCHVVRRNDSYSSTFLYCPECGSSPLLDLSVDLYSIPRVRNDCGLVALNHIINKLNEMSIPNEIRSYISHDFIRNIITRSGGTWTYGNQYELNDLVEVMRKINIISYSPYITHPNGTSTVHLPPCTIGVLIRPQNKEHYYSFIPSSFTNTRTWSVYDSLVCHMEGIENDIILQLIGAFVEFSNEAVVPFIVEQVCDEPFCCDDNNYNLASQALPCNIHFVCENCFTNKKMIFHEKYGIYHCTICADKNI